MTNQYNHLKTMVYETSLLLDEVYYLREEVARLKKVEADYKDLLDSSLKHSQQMMNNTLNILLTPGVSEAFVNNASISNQENDNG